MARRRWIATEWNESTAFLRGAEAAHLGRVLRATPGMRAEVVAGENLWLAEIREVLEEEIAFTLLEQIPAESALPLTLLLAVFKFDRFEWAVEKATELGVARIVPLVARRTEKHLAQAAAARVERWRRIAHEAAKQSRRADLPVIDDPLRLQDALARETHGTRLLLAEREHTVLLTDALNTQEPVTLAIGPEGGWTEDEELSFRTAGWHGVSLGPRILRAETAAIAAVAIAGSSLLVAHER